MPGRRSAEQLAQRTRERQENRGVPYLFLKSTRGAIVGDGDDIIIPMAGMKLSMKWKWPSYSARRVSTSRQTGRTITSLATWWRWTSLTAVVATRWIWRAFRPVCRQGHDTLHPTAWIVPKNLWRSHGAPAPDTVIDGVTVQEAQAGDMIHNIPELIEYASSLITVFPGDVMQSGTSGGTGAGRVQRATDQAFWDGETIQASIEGSVR